MPKSRKILLTFDLEEFDLPIEYNQLISTERQLQVSTQGLERLLTLLTEFDVQATFFCTAFYAENRPEQIKRIVAQNHEIGSHMYYHSDYDPSHIRKSKQKLEDICGMTVRGIRSPRLRTLDPVKIKSAGYVYNSSHNPTYLPGRYNNFKAQKTTYTCVLGLHIVPFSVATIFRIPLFWLSFKILPPHFYNFLCKRALRENGSLHLYFHPWEFADMENFDIPFYIKRISGHQLIERLRKLIVYLAKENLDFVTISSYLRTYAQL